MRSLPSRARRRAGFTLIEVLVAVAIFTLGVLGMVRLQAAAVKMSTDARQRAEATFLADQLVARMMISDQATAATFAHHPDGGACAPTGAPSGNAQVLEWLAEVAAAFPRSTADEQQVIVSGVPPSDVTVRLCWRNSETDTPHTLEVTNRVQWP